MVAIPLLLEVQPLIPATGQDLAGNTYWEFKDALKAERYRRIVRYTKRTHLSDAGVSPQWHQWLRHTRPEPPSIQEQSADLTRQAQLKHNAALADARWAAKAQYIEQPKPRAQEAPQSEEMPKSDGQKTSINPGSDYQPAAWVPGGPDK